jgi:hypothetical protein
MQYVAVSLSYDIIIIAHDITRCLGRVKLHGLNFSSNYCLLMYIFLFCKHRGNFSAHGIQKGIFIFFKLSEFSV